MQIQQLNFTRFVFASLIVVFHFARTEFFLENSILSTFVTKAYNFVSYFFILSGFVMIVAYSKFEKVQITPFLVKRFARIFPLLFLSTMAVVGFTILAGHKISLLQFILAFTGLQSWVPGYILILNYPAWAIGVEVAFYLFFPFLLNGIYKKYSTKYSFIAILLIWVITQISIYLWFSSDYNHGPKTSIYDLMIYSPISHINEFLVGNLAGLFFIRVQKKYVGNYDFPLILILVLLYLFLRYQPVGIVYHNGLLSILFAPFIVLLALNRGLISKVLQLRFLVYLGNLSYALYILQVPVMNLVNALMLKIKIGGILDRINVGLVVLFLTSVFCYERVEVPVRNWILNKYNELKKS